MKISEDHFQIQTAKLLDLLKLDWFHTPNGGKRNLSTAAKMKRMGVKAGIPDIIIINKTLTNNTGICIELKIGRNKTTINQEMWRSKFVKNDWLYFIAYSIDDIISITSKYYGK